MGRSAILLAIAFTAMRPEVAEAHPLHALAAINLTEALATGLLHPWSGWDHLLAMVAVGLWARQRGSGSEIWRLPAAFVAALATGALAGHLWGSSAAAEMTIAASLIVLGTLLVCSRTLSSVQAATVVALAGLAHGWAHGAEMSATQLAPQIAIFSGFIASSAMLHATGVALAVWSNNRLGSLVPRLWGAATAGVGCLLLWAT